MTAYFISGLGADRRMFQKLQLPTELTVVHLDWIEPIPGETITDYCRRLVAGIDTSKDFVIVGLSFGGMIATELSQMIQPKQTILISSAGSRAELPLYFRVAGALKLDLLLPSLFLKQSGRVTYWLFGVKSKEERLLLKQIIKDTSPTFLKWSVRSILSWKRTKKPMGLFHIHSSRDKILPVRYVKADYVVPDGGHLMVFTSADKISRILTEQLGYS